MLLTDREWKEFKLEDLFSIYTGTDLIMNKVKKGDIPIISHTAINNGIACWSELIQNRKLFSYKKTISLADRGNFKAFVQKCDFYIGTRVKALEAQKDIPHNSLCFISNQIDKQAVKFSYGYNACDNVGRISIMLPIDKDSNPDYDFMDAYIKEYEERKEKEYFDYIKDIVENLEYKNILSLEEKEWEDFYIADIFNIKPGKRLTKANMISGNTPFIGSTDSNNGITNFVCNTNITLDMNVLGVNYNGSVVENFYHPYKCIFSDDVKRFHLTQLPDNKYVLLFFKTVILKQKNKFTYGYKFNENRMKRQKILVPINKEKQPDYEYMEQYIKNIMFKKYKEYIQYKTNAEKSN